MKVGLVWISARGDFNTPNTSLEGDMGGMNVAVAAGLSNTMLRQQAGLDPAISTKHIVMAGVQDTTPYEEWDIDNSFIETVSAEEIEGDITTGLLNDRFGETNPEFQVATSVAAYAEVLRDSRWVRGLELVEVLDEVDELPWREIDDDAADEFRDLLERAVRLDG